MTDTKDDGGPAFPRDHAHDGHNGMSLRDYFAAKAMPSAYASYCQYALANGWHEDWAYGVAQDAYRMADAMLKARKS